jgi:hypothetical protein
MLLEGAVAPGGRMAFLTAILGKEEGTAAEYVLRTVDGDKVTSELSWPWRRAHPGRAALAMTDHWRATCGGSGETGIEVALVDTSEHRVRLRLVLEGATRASMSFGRDQLCVADDDGGIAVVDLEAGETRVLDAALAG